MRRALMIVLLFGVSAALAAETPVDGPRVTTAAGARRGPRIAVGQDRSLVTWRDERRYAGGEIYVARLDREHNLLDPTGIRLAVGPAEAAAAAVPGGFVVVVSRACTSGPLESFFVADDGRVSSPTLIAAGPLCAGGSLEVATNGETVVASLGRYLFVLGPRGDRVATADFGSVNVTTVTSNGSEYFAATIDRPNNSAVSVHRLTKYGSTIESKVYRTFPRAVALALDYDGANYLLAVGGDGVDLQRFAQDGTPNAAPARIPIAQLSVSTLRIAWNGSSYLLAFGTIIPSSGLRFARIRSDGETIEPVVSYGGDPISSLDIEREGNELLLVWARNDIIEGMRVSADFLSRGTPIPDVIVSRSSPQQTWPKMIRVGDSAVVVWREVSGDRGAHLRARRFTKDAAALGEAVDITSLTLDGFSSHAVAYDGATITVAWTDAGIKFRRFTRELASLDPQPIVLATAGYDVSAAGGNGVTAIAWNDTNTGRILAAMIETSSSTANVTSLQLPAQQFPDFSPIVVRRATDFVIVFARSLGPVDPLGVPPPRDIAAIVINDRGASNRQVVTVARQASPAAAASNGDTVYVAWSNAEATYVSLLDRNLTPIKQERLSDRYIVSSVDVAAHDGGYAAAWGELESGQRIALQVKAISASGNQGPRTEVARDDVYSGALHASIQSVGGSVLTAYDRADFGPAIGGLARVFVQRVDIATMDVPPPTPPTPPTPTPPTPPPSRRRAVKGR